MKVKKVLPAFALAALAVVGLAACNPAQDPSTPEGPSTPVEPSTPSQPSLVEEPEIPTDVRAPITVWAPAEEHPVINAVVDAYNATVADEAKFTNLNLVAISEADAGGEIVKNPTAEGYPSLFLCADDQIYNIQANNIALNIGGEWKTRIQANNSEVGVLGASYNGNVYGFPVTSDNGYFLWYNKAALSETQVGSLETILETARTTGKKVLMDVSNGWYANSFIMSPDACGTESLRWKSVDGKVSYETTWDNAEGVKVSSYIGSLLKPYYDDGTLITGSNPEIIAGFEGGTMIAAVSGTWMETDLLNAMGDNSANLASAKLPTYTVEGKAYQMSSFTGSKVYTINRTATVDEQKTALYLADLLTRAESQITRFELRNTLPCNKEAAEDARYTEHVTLGGAALNIQNNFACVQSLTAEGRYWDVGAAIGRAYLDGNLGDYGTWENFLKGQMDILRQAM